MPEIEVLVITFVQQLECGLKLARPLLFPEICCLGDSPRRLADVVERRVREVLEETRAGDLRFRRLASEPRVNAISLTLDPPRRDVGWCEPLRLTFHFASSRHREDAELAYVPALDLSIVAECTPEQLTVLEREHPQVLNSLRRLEVAPPDEVAGRRILALAAAGPAGDRPRITGEAIDMVDRLHRRWATYSAYPGRPLRFLRNLLNNVRIAEPLQPADVIAAFSAETGLPRMLLDEPIRRAFHRRVWSVLD